MRKKSLWLTLTEKGESTEIPMGRSLQARPNFCELHIFVDASSYAYATAVDMIRITNANKAGKVSLTMAKKTLAPIKGRLIPKLK